MQQACNPEHQAILDEMDGLVQRAEARRAAAKDATVRGLRPAACDWMYPEELQRMMELEAAAFQFKESIETIRARLAEKRAARKAQYLGNLA